MGWLGQQANGDPLLPNSLSTCTPFFWFHLEDVLNSFSNRTSFFFLFHRTLVCSTIPDQARVYVEYVSICFYGWVAADNCTSSSSYPATITSARIHVSSPLSSGWLVLGTICREERARHMLVMGSSGRVESGRIRRQPCIPGPAPRYAEEGTRMLIRGSRSDSSRGSSQWIREAGGVHLVVCGSLPPTVNASSSAIRLRNVSISLSSTISIFHRLSRARIRPVPFPTACLLRRVSAVSR